MSRILDELLPTPGHRLIGLIVVILASAVLHILLQWFGLGWIAGIPLVYYLWWWTTYVGRYGGRDDCCR